ncbi:hypothetical protein Tco_0335657 [Tanacetum coccineum]
MIPRTDLCFDVHNDGYFSHLPLSYVNGVILNMGVPRMPYEKFAEYLEEKYGNYFQGLYYQVPNIELERGLVRVSDDRELSYMFDVSQVITPEMDACVSKTMGPPKKKYCNDFSMDEIVDWAEMEVEQQGRTSTVDSKFDSEYDSDKSVDCLSPNEEELIELVNRMKANREAKAKGNSVSEMNEPNDENNMSADNVRGETFKEHDIYMNELLTRLKTTDKDGKTQDPFIYVEKYVEKYPMYDETTQWRLRKPKVGKKYVTVEQFKECITYYALANGFVLCYERSSRKKVVVKCGQRPPRLSVHEKGNKESRVETFGMLELYLDYLDMNLSEYISQVITPEMDACVSKTMGPPKKKYCNDFSMDEIVDWAEMVGGGLFKARTSTVDSKFDSEYDSDKSVDCLSPNEEELIEHVNRKDS